MRSGDVPLIFPVFADFVLVVCAALEAIARSSHFGVSRFGIRTTEAPRAQTQKRFGACLQSVSGVFTTECGVADQRVFTRLWRR